MLAGRCHRLTATLHPHKTQDQMFSSPAKSRSKEGPPNLGMVAVPTPRLWQEIKLVCQLRQ